MVKVRQNPLKDHRNGRENPIYISSDIATAQKLFMIIITIK